MITFTSTPRESVLLGLEYVYQVVATAADDSTPTYSLPPTGDPTGMTINPTAGLVTWMPTSGKDRLALVGREPLQELSVCQVPDRTHVEEHAELPEDSTMDAKGPDTRRLEQERTRAGDRSARADPRRRRRLPVRQIHRAPAEPAARSPRH